MAENIVAMSAEVGTGDDDVTLLGNMIDSGDLIHR